MKWDAVEKGQIRRRERGALSGSRADDAGRASAREETRGPGRDKLCETQGAGE